MRAKAQHTARGASCPGPGAGWLLGLLLGVWAWAAPAAWADSLRVLSVEYPSAVQTNPAVLARSLASYQADVLFFLRLPRDEVCSQLAQALKPAGYSLLVQSSFRNARTSVEGRRQVAIFARCNALTNRSEIWRASDKADQPGGYAMAVIPTSQGCVGLFAVQLDDRLARAATGLQNYAAARLQANYVEQWVRAVDSCHRWPANAPQLALMAGDFGVASNEAGGDVAAALAAPEAGLFVRRFLKAPLDEASELAGSEATAVVRLRPNSLCGVAFEGSLVQGVVEFGPALASRLAAQTMVPAATNPASTGAAPDSAPAASFGGSGNFISNQVLFPVPKGVNWEKMSFFVQSAPTNAEAVVEKSNAPPERPSVPQTQPSVVSSNQAGAAPAAVSHPPSNSVAPLSLHPGNTLKTPSRPGFRLWALVAVGAVLAGGMSVGWWWRCRSRALVPEGGAAESALWRQRALAAEEKAARAQAAVRAGLLPQLSHWLRQALLQRLLSQRRELLQVQKDASLKARALGEHLASLEQHADVQKAAYEQQIQALTRELQNAREENRELIRAQIARIQSDLMAAQKG